MLESNQPIVALVKCYYYHFVCNIWGVNNKESIKQANMVNKLI